MGVDLDQLGTYDSRKKIRPNLSRQWPSFLSALLIEKFLCHNQMTKRRIVITIIIIFLIHPRKEERRRRIYISFQAKGANGFRMFFQLFLRKTLEKVWEMCVHIEMRRRVNTKQEE